MVTAQNSVTTESYANATGKALERSEHIAEWVRLAEKKATIEEDKPAQLAPVSKGGRGKESGIRAASRELNIDKDAAHRAVKVDGLSDEAPTSRPARRTAISSSRSLAWR